MCKMPDARCHLGISYKMEKFDVQLKGRYRESVFLSHDMVPLGIKKSLSPVYFIESGTTVDEPPAPPDGVQKVIPNNESGVSVRDIKRRFGNRTESVLRFHSLYAGLKYDECDKDMLNKLKLAFGRSDFLQHP